MRILYVTTISNTVNAFLIPHIKMLVDLGHQVDVAFSIEREVRPEIYEMGCQVHDLTLHRSPFGKGNYQAYRKLKQIILDEKYDLVHTHTPVASAYVRLACRKIMDTKVFYTAHGFHFYKGAPLKNWLIFYPIEKWLSKYTDTLITINDEDYKRAKSKFKAKKTNYIPGVGLDVDKYRNTIVDKKAKLEEIGLPVNAFVVLSVGELNRNKNHEVIMRAIAKIGNPDIYYIICGQGQLYGYLRNVSKEIGIENQIHLLGFRKDIPEICKASDIFVFPSLREGLGMAALEAMACGLPLVTSNVHGILDYSIDDKTGYNCSPLDIDSFSKHIKALYDNADKRNQISANNIEAAKKFDQINVLKIMGQIYT